jgi:hypothetical protein
MELEHPGSCDACAQVHAVSSALRAASGQYGSPVTMNLGRKHAIRHSRQPCDAKVLNLHATPDHWRPKWLRREAARFHTAAQCRKSCKVKQAIWICKPGYRACMKRLLTEFEQSVLNMISLRCSHSRPVANGALAATLSSASVCAVVSRRAVSDSLSSYHFVTSQITFRYYILQRSSLLIVNCIAANSLARLQLHVNGQAMFCRLVIM